MPPNAPKSSNRSRKLGATRTIMALKQRQRPVWIHSTALGSTGIRREVVGRDVGRVGPLRG